MKIHLKYRLRNGVILSRWGGGGGGGGGGEFKLIRVSKTTSCDSGRNAPQLV